MHNILISRDSKNKIRIVDISCEWNETLKGYVIDRKTSQYEGKVTQQPLIVIQVGKAKRTVTEQANLEYASHIRKYLDKGYKDIREYGVETLDEFNPEMVPTDNTDQNGFKKHMLAKLADDVSSSTIERPDYWYASRKIDGVRNSFYFKDGEVRSASRGGKNYDYATTHIRTHPKLIEFFKTHPGAIFDGELYIHGLSLQTLSGTARLEGGDLLYLLEYYIYDVMIEDKDFEYRKKWLDEVAIDLNLTFDPNRTWDENELRIQMVPHEKVSGWNNIQKLHDKYVQEGWEGCVIRDPKKNYKFGGRGSEMIKVKMRKDDTFKVIGYELGLRGVEDMCFILETKEGKPFKAKPMGNRQVKESYMSNIESLIGQKADCTFFYYSDDGVPLQPVFKAFRYDLD